MKCLKTTLANNKISYANSDFISKFFHLQIVFMGV